MMGAPVRYNAAAPGRCGGPCATAVAEGREGEGGGNGWRALRRGSFRQGAGSFVVLWSLPFRGKREGEREGGGMLPLLLQGAVGNAVLCRRAVPFCGFTACVCGSGETNSCCRASFSPPFGAPLQGTMDGCCGVAVAHTLWGERGESSRRCVAGWDYRIPGSQTRYHALCCSAVSHILASPPRSACSDCSIPGPTLVGGATVGGLDTCVDKGATVGVVTASFSEGSS